VLVDEGAQRRDVLRVVDARHERVGVGVVERRCSLFDVDRDGAGPGAFDAVTMSTRWPAHVKRTPLTGPEGTVAPCWRRLLLIVAGLVAAWLVACLILFVWPPAESSVPAHADVVVVLSGSMRRLPPAPRPRPAWRRTGACTLDRPANETLAAGRRLCAMHRYAAARVICFTAVPFSTQGEARGHHAARRAAGGARS